jgi:hypothetical protein
MPLATETYTPPRLVTSHEPKGPKKATDKGTPGDQALMDALCILGAAWVLLFLLMFSVRSHNL